MQMWVHCILMGCGCNDLHSVHCATYACACPALQSPTHRQSQGVSPQPLEKSSPIMHAGLLRAGNILHPDTGLQRLLTSA
jgi:hypothetical protein